MAENLTKPKPCTIIARTDELSGLARGLGRRLAPGLVALIALCTTGVAMADELSGTWTGELHGLGNYYYERSTRVVVPTGGLKLVSPGGVEMSADYLVDVITSASIAQTGSDEDDLFVELRQGVGLGLGKEFDLGETPFKVDLHGSYSTEDDYRALSYGSNLALSLDQRNTVLRLGATHVLDSIESNANVDFDESLRGVTARAGFDQVINQLTTLSLSYQFGYLSGFLANAYRAAPLTPPESEAHPPERFRHTGSARFAFFIPGSDTAIHLLYAAYLDSWDIAAISPELRIYQELGPAFILRTHYRYYRQTSAYFCHDDCRPGFSYPALQQIPKFRTNDPKMSKFRTHTLGLKAELGLGGLDDSFLGFASRGWLELNVDHIWNNNVFGNGIIIQFGGRLPF